VFFCKDFPGTKIIHKNDALYLHIQYHNEYKQFKWMLEFDLLESGSSGFVFTKDEFKQAIQIFESKPFDFKFRQQRGLNESKYRTKNVESRFYLIIFIVFGLCQKMMRIFQIVGD
jgi:hypothetical protein